MKQLKEDSSRDAEAKWFILPWRIKFRAKLKPNVGWGLPGKRDFE
jgi:hypothetical protein